MEKLHGRDVVKIGNRYFAIEKDLSRVDRIAAVSASGVRREPFVRMVLSQGGRARVCSNLR